MGLQDTNAKEIANERFLEAKKGISDLQAWLKDMDYHLERRLTKNDDPGFAFPIHWCSIMIEKAFTVYNEIARGNGAILVRGTTPEKETVEVFDGPSMTQEEVEDLLKHSKPIKEVNFENNA